MTVTGLQPDRPQIHQNPSVCYRRHPPAGPRKEGALVCSKGTNLGPAQQSSAGLLPLKKGDYSMAIASQRISLWRIQQLTSVAFGATAGP